MNQHESRKFALQAIFLANQDKELTEQAALEKTQSLLKVKASEYAKTLLEGVLQNRAHLEEEISTHLKRGWRLERVSAITVAILELAVYEIQSQPTIEAKVAVNEALNLCDDFTDPSAKPFVNGVLANFVN